MSLFGICDKCPDNATVLSRARYLCDIHADETPNAVTVLELAEHRLGHRAEHGGHFEQAGLPIMGGCQVCEATIAAYNACPSTTGFLRCGDCIGPFGWETVEQANQDLFEQGGGDLDD